MPDVDRRQAHDAWLAALSDYAADPGPKTRHALASARAAFVAAGTADLEAKVAAREEVVCAAWKDRASVVEK